MKPDKLDCSWVQARNIDSFNYLCVWCDIKVASQRGWDTGDDPFSETFDGFCSGDPDYIEGYRMRILICPHCSYPSIMFTTIGDDEDSSAINQYPAIAPVLQGEDIASLDKNVKQAYQEARICISNGAYTATAMLCRKLLMHIAVSKGADKGKDKDFEYYIEYLGKKQHITLDLKDWADKVRKIGNDANHEIGIVPKNKAKKIFEFVQLLLVVTYKFSYKRKQLDKDSKNA